MIDNFRIGIEYKSELENNVTYNDIDWIDNKVDGETTSITPPPGAYDIFYHVERAKAGVGFESKLRDNIGGYVHDHEDCWESYRVNPPFNLEVKVRACQ